MRGNRYLLYNNLILLLLALSSFCLSGGLCSAATGPVVAILLSDGDETYRQQASTFSEVVGVTTRVFNLQGDIKFNLELKDKVFKAKPALIYALGAKAAFAAKLWTRDRQDIPVLFAMVLNWQRYHLLDGQANMAGIAAEIAIGTQFVNMTMFSPGVKRIGLLYSHNSAGVLKQAVQAADMLGLELVIRTVVDSKDLSRNFKAIEGSIDAFWLLNDPLLYTVENMDWLAGRCLHKHLLCVGQSQNLVKSGMTLAVIPDLNQTSTQAAALARNILLHGQKPETIKVMEPLATQVFLNLKTAKRIGLDISPNAQNMATTIIE